MYDMRINIYTRVYIYIYTHVYIYICMCVYCLFMSLTKICDFLSHAAQSLHVLLPIKRSSA